VNVFVTGGTGYVGVKVVERLVALGHHVRLFQRPHSTRKWERPDVERVDGDLFDSETLVHGMRDCDAVIHLVGIIREDPRKHVTMKRIHVDGTRRVIEAAIEGGVSTMVHMSALGARPDAVTPYHQSKWAAEELVRSSGLQFTIFRPSVIFGHGGPGPEFVGQLADLVRKAPIVPMIGHGRYPLQPVSIDVIAQACEMGLHSTTNRSYEVGGPEVLTYRQILQKIAAAMGKKLHTISVPAGIFGRMIPVLEHLPGFPITRDQFMMLMEGNACRDPDSFYMDFPVPRIPFEVRF
jgi:nucleoside-diphosphate-sugar epimerase